LNIVGAQAGAILQVIVAGCGFCLSVFLSFTATNKEALSAL
jgi:hypothetical protein